MLFGLILWLRSLLLKMIVNTSLGRYATMTDNAQIRATSGGAYSWTTKYRKITAAITALKVICIFEYNMHIRSKSSSVFLLIYCNYFCSGKCHVFNHCSIWVWIIPRIIHLASKPEIYRTDGKITTKNRYMLKPVARM